jgi:hypothetical protein
MLARFAVAILALAAPAAAYSGGTQLVIGAVVMKRVQLSVQGDRLVVRSNSREGVMLSFGTTTVVVPGGVQVLDLRQLGLPADAALQITASPL